MLATVSSSTATRRSRRYVTRLRLGFTLIELVVTIAVAAILASLAGPSFRQFIASQRVKNASFDLVSALSLTRSEAVTRNADVFFCQLSGAWANGWNIWTSSAACATTATPLFTHEAFKNVSVTPSATLTQISFGRDGRPAAAIPANFKFTIAPSSTISGVKCRFVAIGLTGVPSSTEGACP